MCYSLVVVCTCKLNLPITQPMFCNRGIHEVIWGSQVFLLYCTTICHLMTKKTTTPDLCMSIILQHGINMSTSSKKYWQYWFKWVNDINIQRQRFDHGGKKRQLWWEKQCSWYLFYTLAIPVMTHHSKVVTLHWHQIYIDMVIKRTALFV